MGTPPLNATITCPSCGYNAYANPKPVACVIPRDRDGRIWLMRRGIEPRMGFWAMPGGYVELDESAEQAAQRELMEEMGLPIELTGLHGIYSRANDRALVIVYTATALATPTAQEEALEVRGFAPTDIPWPELAFWSDEAALRDLLGSPPSA